MEKFICDDPRALVDAAAFSINPWGLVLFFAIITCFIYFPPKPIKRSTKLAVVTGLTAMLLTHLTISTQNQSRNVLKTGNHDTIIGQVEDIITHTRRSRRLGTKLMDGVEIRLTATLKSKDGESKKIEPENIKQRVIAENKAFFGIGKPCRGRTCGLKIGDKVRVLANYDNNYSHATFRSYVPLRIETCSP